VKYRSFGRLDWPVAEVGYGMWGMGGWTGSDDEESLASLDRAVELGCNFFDSALVYGAGHSDRLLGELVRRHPEKRLYTATKVPPKDGRWPSRRGSRLDDTFPADHIERSVHASLEHSGLASFDLVQFHVWEDDWTEDERWQRAMDDLKRQGLIGAVGLSLNRWEPWNGVRAVKSGLVDAVQVIYNVFDQAPEDELFPACAEHGVGVLARVPFDEGGLTGRIGADTTFPDGDFRDDYFRGDRRREVGERVAAIAADLGVAVEDVPEAALRYILSAPEVSTVIPGMRSVRNVERNIAAGDGRGLPAEQVATLKQHRWIRNWYR